MNLMDFINSGTNLSLTVSTSDLIDVYNYIVSTTRKEMEQTIADRKDEVYLTPDEVAKLIGVSKVTLWRWRKSGYLVPIGIGGLRKYLRSEVMTLLTNREIK